MATNQEGKYTALLDIAGISTATYNEAVIAANLANGGTATDVNGAWIELLQSATGSTSTNLSDLQAEYAIANGFASWNEVNTFVVGLTAFTPTRFVVNGASIMNFTYETQFGRDTAVAIAVEVYGVSISAAEYAVAGRDIATIEANVPAMLSAETAEGAAFVMHAGGNDISYGTQFLSLSGAAQTQKQTDYQDVINLHKTDGRKFFPFGLTFRNGGPYLDNDPAVKSNELGGSFTYNRDWILPIIESNYPFLFRDDGTTPFSLYEITRTMYDPYLGSGDQIHPSEWGEMLLAVYMTTVFMDAAQGNLTAAFTERNFNEPERASDEALDILIQWYASNPTAATNVNKISVPFGTSTKRGYRENLIQTDGSTTNVSVLHYGGNKAFPLANPGADTTLDLTNTQIQSDGFNVEGSAASIGVIVYGLEPSRKYQVSWAHKGITTGEDVYINTGAPVTIDGGTAIATVETMTDPYGRILLRNKENNINNRAGISGLQIKSLDFTPLSIEGIEGYWDFLETTSLWTDTGKTVQAVDTNDVANWENLVTVNTIGDFLQASASPRPTLQSANGLSFNGFTPDSMATNTFAAGTLSANSTVVIAMNRLTDDAFPVLYDANASSTRYLLVGQNGSTAAAFAGVGSPTFTLNGSTQVYTNRDQVRDSMGTSADVVFVVRNADLSLWTRLGIGSGTGQNLTGRIRAIAVGGAITDAALARLTTYVNARW